MGDASLASLRASASSRPRRGTRSVGKRSLPIPAEGTSPPYCSAPIPLPASAAATLRQSRRTLNRFGRYEEGDLCAPLRCSPCAAERAAGTTREDGARILFAIRIPALPVV